MKLSPGWPIFALSYTLFFSVCAGHVTTLFERAVDCSGPQTSYALDSRVLAVGFNNNGQGKLLSYYLSLNIRFSTDSDVPTPGQGLLSFVHVPSTLV
jgi:hypothetical protein